MDPAPSAIRNFRRARPERAGRGPDRLAGSARRFRFGKRSATIKTYFLAVALLQATLPGAAGANDTQADECGLASVYSSTSEATASGEDTLPEDFTAAHRTLPFGTIVHVQNYQNGRSAVVRITDRGPYIAGRIVDVSQVAARDLGISGLAQVCLTVTWTPVGKPKKQD